MATRAIFVSYSHHDRAQLDGLLPHLRALEQAGLATNWIDRDINAGERWYPEIAKAIQNADVAICWVTANFLASDFCVKEEVPALIRRRDREGLQLIFVLAAPCQWKTVPWIAETAVLPSGGRNILQDFAGLEAVAYNEVTEAILRGDRRSAGSPVLEFAELDRLPPTGAELVGRADVVQELDRAWSGEGVRIVSLVAQGGTGKTTVLSTWCRAIIQRPYSGVRRAFGWSFYRPGLTESGAAADAFVADALARFGDANPGTGSPWDRGARLARLVAEQPSLIVLDGLEPLQSSFAADRGKLLDPALATFFAQLSRAKTRSMCVISTRARVRDFDELPAGSTLELGLEQMSAQAGCELLRIGHVLGGDDALEQASQACGNHALALRLLVGYVLDQEGQHIDAAAPLLSGSATPVERIVAELERGLGEGAEVQLLRCLGLFDRPADPAALAALRAAAIPMLSDALNGESYARATIRLRALSLIEEHRDGALDCHPLIREHFARRVAQREPAAWRRGNGCLYKHYAERAEHHPDTLRGLTPLYRAVMHACLCGQAQQAFDEVYWQRISRADKFYSTKTLGAYGADLACLAGLFAEPWHAPLPELTPEDQAHVLTLASTRLRALGRTDAAEEPIRAAVLLNIAQQDWSNAANSSRNLSELLLDRGWIREAVATAEESLELARLAGPEQLTQSLAALAHAHQQAGSSEYAADLFEQARAVQANAYPDRSLLDSQPGFQYCASLLDRGLYLQARAHAQATLARARHDNRPLNVGRDLLTVGSAYLSLGEQALAREHLAEAELVLRQAGALNFVVYAPLARAELYVSVADYSSARTELEEALSLATNMGARLREADSRLALAKVQLALGQRERSRHEYRRADALIRWAGYERRNREAADLRAALARKDPA